MTKKIYSIFIKDICDSIEKIEKFTSGISFERFKDDDEKSSAVIRKLEIIGEAAKNLPEDVKIKYPQVDWRGMAGLRDKLIHFYFGVDYEILWKIIKEDIPKIGPLLEKILLDEIGAGSE